MSILVLDCSCDSLKIWALMVADIRTILLHVFSHWYESKDEIHFGRSCGISLKKLDFKEKYRIKITSESIWINDYMFAQNNEGRSTWHTTNKSRTQRGLGSFQLFRVLKRGRFGKRSRKMMSKKSLVFSGRRSFDVWNEMIIVTCSKVNRSLVIFKNKSTNREQPVMH